MAVAEETADAGITDAGSMTVPVSFTEGLSRPGYRIAGIASTGEDAIAKTAGANPDPVLMDIGRRGGIDGIEAAGRIDDLHYRAWFTRGIALERLWRYDEALDTFNLALSVHGTKPHVLRAKGTLLRKMGIDNEFTKCYAAAELYTK